MSILNKLNIQQQYPNKRKNLLQKSYHNQQSLLLPQNKPLPFLYLLQGPCLLHQYTQLQCKPIPFYRVVCVLQPFQYLLQTEQFIIFNKVSTLTMDLDFILFSPPKSKYSFVDFWGETIFIPRMRKKQKNENSLSSFLNCYKATTTNEVHLTIDAALLQAKGTLELDSQLMTQATSNIEQEEIEKYIPCLYLNSMVGSKYLIFYLHASGEDIKLSHKMLDLLRNLYQINVVAMEYSGYSIYKGKTSSQIIKDDSHYVYNYIINKLGFKPQNIIVIGRSIGTAIALELMQKVKPGALALISPFVSVKSLASEFIGFLGQLFAKQTYDNRANIQTVACPTFFLHGRKDQVISVENSYELSKLCLAKRKYMINPTEMTHSQFDFYSDLADPLRQFLMHNQFNFYQPNQNGPILSDNLFQFPDGFKL